MAEGELFELLKQEGVHPVDLAEFLEDADLPARIQAFETLEPDRAAQVLAALSRERRIELVDAMGEDRLGPVLDRLPDTVLAGLLEHLPVRHERAILEREPSRFPPGTAGGRMTRDFVSVPKTFTAEETIRAIQGSVTPHTVEFVYVVDEHRRLGGVLSLHKIVTQAPEARVADFMRRDVTFVGPATPIDKVGRIARKYRLRHVPVVDDGLELLGVVTLQELIDVIRREADEDVLKIAGAARVDLLRAPLFRRIRARVPWLAGCLALELLVSWVMRGYGRTLDRRVLAYFIPAIMAMGGNVGLQSATVVVRGLATGHLGLGHLVRVLLAELRMGITIGLLAASTIAIAAFVLSFGAPEAASLAAVVFLSMTISLTTAASFGAYLPFLMRRLGRDPAVASGPFVTGFNDLLNVTIYLTAATLLL